MTYLSEVPVGIAGADTAEPEAARKARARRLVVAAAELLAVARELDENVQTHPTNGQTAPFDWTSDAMRSAGLARQLYRDRRLRVRIFGDESLFGEPAWDVLLDLYVAAQEGKRVPVTSACIGAAVPTTTALRWLTILENRGLVLREADANDARRVFVRLSEQAEARMHEYFARTAVRAPMRDEPPFMLGK